ncbi:hypothetical protein MBLNU230_g2108t1 [Neophaeotheca triangularis]
MDIVLEIFDTFIGDPVYAKLLPRQALPPFDPISTITASFKGYPDANASWADSIAHGAYQASTWTWEPASQYFNLEPSHYAYESQWDRDNMWRQMCSFLLISWFFGICVYFFFASLSYVFIFDKDTFKHPKYLKNQMRMEIQQTMGAIPIIAVFTAPIFVLEVRGYSFVYDTVSNPGFTHPLLSIFGSSWNWIQFPVFFCFTDFCIYWIHRALHSKLLYRRLHKPHHKWIMPTPYASHAFHPLDGYAQGVPYHIFVFLFPLQKFAYIALFTFIQIWTVMIHDGEYVANSAIINGAACHTMHHLYFNYNYGQFTTFWDRLGGSYRKPNMELFYKETKMSAEEWQRQVKEMEQKVVEVEGKDERSYGDLVEAKKVQ